MQELSKSQVIAYVTAVFVPDDQTPAPPELGEILGVLAQVLGEELQYNVFDPESDEFAQRYELGDEFYQQLGSINFKEIMVSQWSGLAPGACGYGDLQTLELNGKRGVVVSLGGSPLSSAASFWVLPVGWIS